MVRVSNIFYRMDTRTDDRWLLGVGVSQTLEILQTENPHVPLLPRDIYNARAAINRNPYHGYHLDMSRARDV